MSNEYTNKAKPNSLCNAEGAKNEVRQTKTAGSSNETFNFNNYGQYCFNRLPCGICTRTNQMCPFAGNSNTEPTCDPLRTPVNPMTNPQVWYNMCTTDSSRNDSNVTATAKNKK